MKTLNIAGVGGWHLHANDFVNTVLGYPDCRVVAVWDDDSARGETWANKANCRFEPDYERLLADKTLDAVMITCETTRHAEMIIKAAKAGKHIYVEKSAFVTREEAYEAREAVRKSGVKFMVGSPIVKPMHLLTRKMIDEGKLGKITTMRYRTVHALAELNTQLPGYFEWEQSGGGAMIDMGYHAVHLLSWFAGYPKRVTGIFQSCSEPAVRNRLDDNDVAVMEFENGILGVIETGWITPWYQYGFDIYGTKGSVSMRAYQMFYRLEGQPWVRVDASALPEPESYPIRYWLDCIQNDEPVIRDNIDVAVQLTEMVESTYKAAGMPIKDSIALAGLARRSNLGILLAHESGAKEVERIGASFNPRCVWDANADRGREKAREIDAEFVDDYQSILDNPEIEAVFIAEEPGKAGPLILAAARAGKHILTTNVALESVEIASQIKAQVEKKRLSYQLCRSVRTPQTAFAKRLGSDGGLGRLTNLRVRCVPSDEIWSQSPKEAYVTVAEDAYLTLLDFFGAPVGCRAMVSSAEATTSVMLFEFSDSRLGIAETCVKSPKSAYSVDLLGTKGWLRIREDRVSYTNADPMDRDASWVEVEALEMPADDPAWPHGIGNARAQDGIDRACRVTEMLLNARRSAENVHDIFSSFST